ncbi:hypothetical protein JTE90_000019, partial [Oedothorax gibbosus]
LQKIRYPIPKFLPGYLEFRQKNKEGYLAAPSWLTTVFVY